MKKILRIPRLKGQTTSTYGSCIPCAKKRAARLALSKIKAV